jgi:chromosome segregation ATPase
MENAINQIKFGNIDNCYKELEAINPEFKELTNYNEETVEMLEFEQEENERLEKELSQMEGFRNELLTVIEQAIQMLEEKEERQDVINFLDGKI